MGAVWMAFRSELRDRWRAWVGLAMLIGIAAGFVIAATAGARRTDSAYARFLDEQRAFDVIVFPQFCPTPEEAALEGEEPYECDLAHVADLPSVRGSALVASLPVDVRIPGGRSLDPGGGGGYTGVGEATVLGGVDGRFGTEINRMHIVEGRLPDPDTTDEVAISKVLAERGGIEIGDTLRTSRLERAEGSEDGPQLPRLTFRVVGIEVSPFEIQPPSGEYVALVHVTPAAIRHVMEIGARVEVGAAVRLRNGAAGVDDLHRELEARRIAGLPVYRQADQAEGIQRVIEPEAVSLAVIAAISGLAALAMFGSVLGRQAWAASAGFATMWSLGLRRRQLIALTVVRGSVVAAVAALLAVIVAVALSPLTPIGLARTAEPDPGIAVDGLIISVGFLATFMFVVLLVAWPAWRIARAASATRGVASGRPATLAAAVATAPLSPAAVTGVRMALDPGRGGNAVPVRTGFFGVTASVVALVAALGFSSGLDHLVSTPRLVGFSWDAIVFAEGEDDHPDPGSEDTRTPLDVRDAARRLGRLPEVDGVTVGSYLFNRPFPDTPLQLGDERTGVELIVMDPGGVKPVVIEGRAPTGPGEILLGPDTLDELGLEIGDHVRAYGQVGESDRPDAYEETVARMRVVGTGAVPALTSSVETSGRLGRGALMTVQGLRSLNPVARSDVVFVSFGEGTDRAAGYKVLRRAVRGHRAAVFSDETSDELDDAIVLERVDNLPVILAGLLTLLATAVLLHLLVTSVRTRRRDLAVLRALGFRRRDLRAVIAWQATTVVVIALAVGLPLGTILGGRAWEYYAGTIGVLPEAAVPVIGMAIAVAGGVLIANLVARWPAGVAARTRPAQVLRSE